VAAQGRAQCKTDVMSLLGIQQTTVTPAYTKTCLLKNMNGTQYWTQSGLLMASNEGIPAVNEAITFLQN